MRLRLCIYALLIGLLSACSSHVINSSAPTPLPFPQAVDTVANALFKGIQAQQYGLLRWFPTTVAVEPVVNAYSLEELKVNPLVLTHFKAIGQRYKLREVVDLDRQVLARSKFLISAQIAYEPLITGGAKYYHLSAVVRDLRSGKIVVSSDAWISGEVPDFKPTQEFSDMPSYLAVNKVPPKPAMIEPLSQLSLKALLNEAGMEYNQGHYQQALALYQQAYQGGGQQELRTLAGLYISHLRLKKIAPANQVFTELLQASFQKEDKLTLKILFKVDSTDFYGSAFTQQQYRFWINTIVNYLLASHSCLIITGHSSHTGTLEYNRNLSLKRAQAIQGLMAKVKNHTTAIGKGFSENIIGSGTDDERDALDRRVEFSKTVCP